LLIGQDLKSPKNCQLAVEQVKSKFGNLNGLINNAGINDSVGLENGTPESYLASFDKNLHHYYYLAHYALPHLKNTKGTIINISSKTAITGQGGTSAYAGAKGAQLAFTREWAVELLPYQIRVNAIIPAEVMTPLYKSWISQFSEPEKKLREISSNIPLGNRFTSPQEIANMALFLLSEKSQHITGQHIYVDGGYVHLDRSLAGI
jgi:NAD(P)-dependent dehydrogenase (short-subunit alcohol dehydrogenase family)